MLILIAIAFYAVLIARRPIDRRLKKRNVGPLSMAGVGVVLFLAWDWLHPQTLGITYFVGEFCGVSAVYLMTLALVLATRLKWIKSWFGGLDRTYFWHRRVALWSMVLLVEHAVDGLRSGDAVGRPLDSKLDDRVSAGRQNAP